MEANLHGAESLSLNELFTRVEVIDEQLAQDDLDKGWKKVLIITQYRLNRMLDKSLNL